MRFAAVFLLTAVLGAAQQQDVQFESLPAYRISNGKLTVTVLKQGSAIASVTMVGDPEARNPLWEPIRMAREAGEKNNFGAGLGHFLCVDGFGGVSKEEQAAGYPFHGEAHTQQFDGRATAASLDLSASLPLAQESVTRILELLPGRPVLDVRTSITNKLSFDRPLQWAEHATVGSPFLEPGATVVDMHAVRAKTRTWSLGAGGGLAHRLPSAKEFTWPNAPTLLGDGTVDMRLTPPQHFPQGTGDHTTSKMDPAQEWVWFTVLNTRTHLLLGYVFRSEEFPWVQSWENYPPSGKLARGLEFSTQPFDVPKRQVVTENSLFSAPTYRWLPAKSTITGHFLLFYTKVPDNWRKVDDVTYSPGAITIKSAEGSLTL